MHRCLSCAAPLPTHACAFVCARLPAPPPALRLPAHAEACACEHRATDYGPRLTGAVCGRAGARVQQALDKALSRVAMLAMGGMGVASVANSCIYDVDGGKRAIMFNRFPNPLTGEGGGVQKHVMGEGTHIKIPYIQDPKIFDVRSRPRAIPTVTGTRDLQMVNITLRLLSRPKLDKLPVIYQQLGLDYDERILPSIANEVLSNSSVPDGAEASCVADAVTSIMETEPFV